MARQEPRWGLAGPLLAVLCSASRAGDAEAVRRVLAGLREALPQSLPARVEFCVAEAAMAIAELGASGDDPNPFSGQPFCLVWGSYEASHKASRVLCRFLLPPQGWRFLLFEFYPPPLQEVVFLAVFFWHFQPLSHRFFLAFPKNFMDFSLDFAPCKNSEDISQKCRFAMTMRRFGIS